MWEGVITFKRCDIHQGGVKVFRKVCQLMEKYEAHGRSVHELGKV